jgi:hypothetical protein
MVEMGKGGRGEMGDAPGDGTNSRLSSASSFVMQPALIGFARAPQSQHWDLRRAGQLALATRRSKQSFLFVINATVEDNICLDASACV